MKILLVNDDGIFAPGLQTMIKAMSKTEHEIYVIAPKYEMSSVGHHMSLRDPVRLYNIEDYADLGVKKAYALQGTPVDCIKFAYHQLKLRFDCVISGINKGGNVGSDVVYSGTVAACIEANILGIPSIAVSSTSYDDNDYEFCADFVLKNFEKLYRAAKPDKVINVNCPDSTKTQIKGVKVAIQGNRDYGDYYEQDGENYYIRGFPKYYGDRDEETDVKYLDLGYVTITPLTFSMVDHSSLQKVEDIFK